MSDAIAPTEVHAGYETDVVPDRAEAGFDARLLPDRDVTEVLRGLRRVARRQAPRPRPMSRFRHHAARLA